MQKTYIVSDVHGNWQALREALFRAEIYDNHGVKDPNAFVVQIGDLANCVSDSIEEDLVALSMVGKDREIDLLLIGNHEMPYFDPQNRFSGFYFSTRIREKLDKLNEIGYISPSYVIGDTLVTHAGLTIEHMSSQAKTAENAHDYLDALWVAKRFQHPLFSDVGRARYGNAHTGGILWCDFGREFIPTPFPQIVGHTAHGMAMKGNAICIDTIRTTGLPTVIQVEG